MAQKAEIAKEALRLLRQAALADQYRVTIAKLKSEKTALQGEVTALRRECVRLRPWEEPRGNDEERPECTAPRARIRDLVLSSFIEEARASDGPELGPLVTWLVKALAGRLKVDDLCAFDRAVLARMCGRDEEFIRQLPANKRGNSLILGDVAEWERRLSSSGRHPV